MEIGGGQQTIFILCGTILCHRIIYYLIIALRPVISGTVEFTTLIGPSNRIRVRTSETLGFEIEFDPIEL